MKPHTRFWLFAFILLGLAASAASFYVHERMLHDPSYAGICDVNRALTCGTVYHSRFATFHEVPVALLGVIWFALALLLALADRPKAGREESGAAAYLFLVSIPAFSAVLLLAYISIFVLQVVCGLCALTYLAVFGVFLIAGAAPNASLAGLPEQAVRDMRALAGRPVARGVAILFLAGAASAVTFFSRPVGDPTAAVTDALAQHQPRNFDLWFESIKRLPVDVPTNGAQVLIVSFTDYQCPACAEFFRTSAPVLAKYQIARPGQVKMVVKDYPLDPPCNPFPAVPSVFGHEAACESAVAVRLARRQDRGTAMEDWLYAHQAGLTPAAVRQAALDVGGVTDFDGQFPQVVAEIQRDVDLGRRLGVGGLDASGMPTLFINGVTVEGGLKPEELEQAIEHELRVRAKR